ncbi:putative Polycomb group protein ASXL2 isoform X1 [Rhineura floridana]|uniref:putative Polycomb group protein ASXL2 isoform X1 n=1 Tax=Rhineura floridana TaxID=261503 RepID=UPI002AC7E992|nr:putative Polycomb group protein ASXL2 isoform X1 [Rhineura floridana]
MLHTNSRGDEGIFYKVPGRMGVYTLKKDVPDGLKELSEGSEESSDVQSDSPTSGSSSSSSSSSDRSSNKEGRKSRWRRKVSSRLSQAPSPQPGCPSPSIPPAKVISSSQKLSKKALKQALKQKQKKQCRAGAPVSSNHHLLQQHSKAASHSAPAKPVWEGKQSDGHSSSPQNSTCSSSPSVKTESSLPLLGKKPLQRSERLHARQLKRTKCAEIDVETPDSILVNTNLRALINKHTFTVLPADCQQRLLLLLPEVDRQIGMDGLLKLSSSALNNEFFTSAAQGWKERLSEGEFTPEMQLRLRQELEKEKKMELWKGRFFESYYGQSSGLSLEESKQLTSCVPAAQSQPQSGNLAAQLQKCTPVSTAVPGKDQGAPPKAQDPLAPPAASREEDEKEKQPQASAPAEELENASSSSDSSSPSKSSGQASCRPSKGAEEEPAQAEPVRDVPRPAFLESPGKGGASRPKSPAAAAASQEKESREALGKEAPAAAGTQQMDTRVQALKRKSEAPEEVAALLTPEKQPHFAEKCSPSRPPFQSPLQSFPTAPVPKVPPLRIRVSRIHGSPAPFPASQVSPTPTFPVTITSPRRTGARTLADIKARAQMARAQWAAAAAAATSGATAAAPLVGAIPGPGPGGGRGRERSSPAAGRPRGPPCPGPCPPTEAQATEPAEASSGAAGAQLQPAPAAQPRTAGPGPRTETPPATQAQMRSLSHTGPLALSASQGAQAPVGSSAGLLPGITGGPGKAPPPRSVASGAAERQGVPEAPLAAGAGAPGGQVPSSPLSSRAAPPTVSPPAVMVPLQPPCSTWSAAPSLPVPPGAPSGRTAAHPKGSSSIPANNPLVAQLLQGKEVPLEQILPKPPTRVERKTLPLPVKESQEPAAPTRLGAGERQPLLVPLQPSGKPDLGQGRQQHLQQQQLSPGPPAFLSFPGRGLWSSPADLYSRQEASVRGAQEHHLLQALMQRVARPGHLPAATASSPPPRLPPGFPPESSSCSQSSMLGFPGRRTTKPAMSGHYLLNVSTYGRCSEHLRRNLAVPPESCLCPAGPEAEFGERELVAGDDSDGGSHGADGGGDMDGSEDEEVRVAMEEEGGGGGGGEQAAPRRSAVKVELAACSQREGTGHPFSPGQGFSGSALARDFIQAAQEHVAQAVRGERKSHGLELPSATQVDSTPPRPPPHPPSQPPRLFGGPAAAQLLGPGYSGTINVSTSPDLHEEALLTGLSDPSHMGEVVSFSVTVTTIPAGQSVNTGSGHRHHRPLQGQAFSGDGGLDLPSKCYCRLKAMIVCKGCGAFCHDDCIGPSKLCVSCLVVR